MSTRMQQRRGTAAQWVSTNNGNGPILAAGEIGYESDTNKFKIGDGVNHWIDLPAFVDEAALGGSLGDYVPLTDLAQPLGVATLDESGKLLSSQIPNIDEISQDAINSALTVGAGISKDYDDEANTITIANTGVVSLEGTANQISLTSTSGAITASLATDLEIPGTLKLSQDPVESLEAATKQYVDNVSSGISFHEPVRVTTTENITLSGTQTIDGVTLSVGDRVLVKDQADAKENGIYNVASSAWSRSSDADNTPDGELSGGDFCLVIEGTVGSGYGYVCSNTGPITIGTTEITYVPFNAAKAVQAGTGLWETAPGVISIDNTVATLEDVQTLKNKNISFADNSVTATIAQLNSAISDADIATLGGTETLENKTLTAPAINNGIISGTEIDTTVLKLNGNTVATASDLSTHASDTTNVHGITDTAALATMTYVDSAVGGIDLTPYATVASPTFTGDITLDNTGDFTISSNDNIILTPGSGKDIKWGTSVIQKRVGNVTDTEIGYLEGVTSAIQTQLDAKATTSALSSHESDTTSIHGIADTSKLITTDGIQTLTNKTITSPSGLVKSDVGLGNVDNTSDADKPVSTATQTALDLKAPKESPAFTGTLSAADVSISGDLTVGGTTTTVNAANLNITDPMIYMGDGNTANVSDLGIVSAFNDGTYQHSGLVRDASDNKWKLFKGVIDEPTTTVNFAQGSLDSLAVGSFEATSITVGNVSNTEISYLDGVTSAIQTQLDAKLASSIASSTYAPLSSPALTGVPTAPTAAALTNTTQIATTAYVQEDNKVAYVTESGTSVTIAQATHMFKTVHCTSSSAVTVSIPTDASDNWPIGTYVNIRQMGTGQVTVVAATPATTTVVATDSQFKSRVRYSEIVLEKIADNSWIVVGDTAA